MKTPQTSLYRHQNESFASRLVKLLVMLVTCLAVFHPGESLAQGKVRKLVIITSDICDGAFSWLSEAQARNDLKGECGKSIQRKRDALAGQLGTHLTFVREVNWMTLPHMRTFKGASNEKRYKALQGSVAYEYAYTVNR